jgi:hypothetical protein
MAENKEWVIKVGTLYWYDTSRSRPEGWIWTNDKAKATRFDEPTATGIIAYWNQQHHTTIYKPDGSILKHATSLGGVLPLNATPEKYE